LQVDATGKREQMLVHLLNNKDIPSALIFCGRRQDIFAITNLLRNNGLRAEAYHGALTQEERGNILGRFREGHFNYLVASDLAARGLDIENLPAVINLNITKEYDFYLHRVGRTGRAGKKGVVYNLISSAVEAAYLANHHKLMGLPVKTLKVESGAIVPVALDRRWTKCALTRGSSDKIRKTDVVGFLVNQASVKPEDIGTITVMENNTVVDLPLEGYESLIYREDLKIKNLTVKIRKYSIEEQENKANAVKKLVRKRNIK
jgi:ATP-independent RNA helicase DbpA